MKKALANWLVVVAATLSACGGGGGDSSGSASSNANCSITKALGSNSLCLNQVSVDGAAYTANIFYAAAEDLNGDGNPDVVVSTNGVSNNNNTLVANKKEVIFLKGSSSPTIFSTWTPTITGVDGKANAYYTRDILFGNFDGAGHTSMYIADQTEYDPGTGFSGTTQYAYINDGNGNFTKLDVGIGLGSVHGSSVGNLTADGFSVVFNNPWVSSNVNVLSIGGNLSTPLTTGILATDPMLNGAGKCFYTVAVMLKNAKSSGGTNSTKKDVICFSPGNVTSSVNNHTIMYNNGAGSFGNPDTLANASAIGWTVEDVVVGNFSGHTDGREDFAVLQVNRSGIGTQLNTDLHIYITDANGVPHDQTSVYFDVTCQSCSDFTNDVAQFHRIQAADLNGDGRTDLVFIRETNHSGPPYPRQVEILLNQGASTAFARKTFAATGSNYMGTSLTVLKPASGSAQILFDYNGKLYAGKLQ